MHSSKLASQDFRLIVEGQQVPHEDFFAGTVATDRFGMVLPSPLDGLGAAAFVLACVTAFYNDIRRQAADAGNHEWRTYPDFYTFQLSEESAAYGMFDIWPAHKDVTILGAHPALAQAVIDRGTHTLLLPASASPRQGGHRTPDPMQPESVSEYDAVHLASLRRAIRSAYLYDPMGEVADADVYVSCPTEPIGAWVAKVRSSTQARTSFVWPEADQTPSVTQCFRRITIDEAIARLNGCEHQVMACQDQP